MAAAAPVAAAAGTRPTGAASPSGRHPHQATQALA